MGNRIGGRRRVKVMKVDGETLKLKAPVRVWEVVKDYPDHVILDSEAVKHYGIKATPLEALQNLSPNKTYFLLQLPKIGLPRRVGSSGVHISAKERLDLLMLSRRTMSEVSFARPPATEPPRFNSGPLQVGGPMQVKLRLPKSQIAKFMEESQSEGDVAEKIIDMYVKNQGHQNHSSLVSGSQHSTVHRQKRVSFFPSEGEIGLAVAANQ